MYMWLVLQDADGVLDTQSFGNMGPPNWHLRTLEIPERMKRPVQLASIQIFEPVFGPAGTAGSILIDDVHAIKGDGTIEYIEDFEDTASSWLPLATSTLSSDVLTFSDDDVNRGDLSGLFHLWQGHRQRVARHIQKPERWACAGGCQQFPSCEHRERVWGDALIVELKGRFVPIQVRDSVDFFPTLNPSGAGFLIADLENSDKTH